jgi:hypothetical protein
MFTTTPPHKFVYFNCYICNMRDLFIIYTGAIFSVNITHILISDLLALATITYTIAKLYLMYKNYKNNQDGHID